MPDYGQLVSMYIDSVFKFSRRALAVLLLLAGAAFTGRAQINDRPWYVGVQGGTSFGQATFASITEHGILWGVQGGLFAGYRVNSFLSLELGAQYGSQAQSALDCCPYWLSAVDGTRYAVAVLDEPGWYYKDLVTLTQWGRASFQVNLNLIGLFSKDSRWSLNLSPQIAAVTTKTNLVTPSSQAELAGRNYPRQWHIGYSGQASLGYRICDRIGASLYGGVSSLTGERFDNIPFHAHHTNLIWDAGVKLAFHLGKPAQKVPGIKAPDADAVRQAEEAARLAELQAENERLERAKAEEARLAAERAREEADRLARERAEREAAEAAAAEERAFRTPIPTVYFANNSTRITDAFDPGLEQALAILQQYPDFKLEIHAYCSNSGSKAYNEKLSERRMEAIRAWFAEHFIAPDRMQDAYFHGIDYNAPSADKARRAELKFVK